MEISLKNENKKIILDLVHSRRIPHTVIIEGDSKEERDNAALLLAAAAVCTSDDKPCLSCNQCKKALEGQHPDMIVPQPSKKLKSGIISLQELRDNYLSQASIKPNEANTKIYLFTDADRLLREDSQNTLLKITCSSSPRKRRRRCSRPFAHARISSRSTAPMFPTKTPRRRLRRSPTALSLYTNMICW